MASSLLSRITGGGASGGGDATSDAAVDKYLLKVTAGTSYDTCDKNLVIVNGPATSLGKNAKVAVRLEEHNTIPGGSTDDTSYFSGPSRSKDTYSIAWSWIPDEEVSAGDLSWGIELVNPIRDRIPKRFITTAFKIAKEFVDSSLSSDPYADRPWVASPAVCSAAMTFRVGEHSTSAVDPADVLAEGADGDGAVVRQKYGVPESESKRRKYFFDEAHQKDFVFEPGRGYQFDFHEGSIDWKNYALKLPGFSLGVLKYINDRTHTLRYVLKNSSTGTVYMVVMFRLLFGDELESAVASESAVGHTGAAVDRHDSRTPTSIEEESWKGDAVKRTSPATSPEPRAHTVVSRPDAETEREAAPEPGRIPKPAVVETSDLQRNEITKDAPLQHSRQTDCVASKVEAPQAEFTEARPQGMPNEASPPRASGMNVATNAVETPSPSQQSDDKPRLSSIEQSLMATATSDLRRCSGNEQRDALWGQNLPTRRNDS